MSNPLLFQDLTRQQAQALAPQTLVVLPVGATEQHGPHLPVGTDFFTVEYIARQAAAKAAEQIPVLVTPTLPFGSSQHHLPFGGTMSLRTETYYRVVYELAESLIDGGFRHVFILNGHGGNKDLIQLVARDLALNYPANLAAASYWVVAWEALVAAEAHRPGRLPGHAGAFETSLMLALQPDLVREPRPHRAHPASADPRSFYQPYVVERHGSWQSFDGYTDSPDRGNASLGETYLAAIIPPVAEAMIEFYDSGNE